MTMLLRDPRRMRPSGPPHRAAGSGRGAEQLLSLLLALPLVLWMGLAVEQWRISAADDELRTARLAYPN
jgi:hypothetical protein